MRRLVPVALAVLLVSCEGSPPDAGDEVAFFRSMLAGLPQARPGAFPTPESVVRAYFQAVIDNAVPQTFRCLPLRRRYEAAAFDEQVRRTGVYDSGSMTVPGDGYRRYIRVLSSHHRTLTFLRFTLLARMDPEVAAILRERTYIDAPMSGDAVDPAWLEGMIERLDPGRLAGWRVKDVTAGPPEEAEELHGIPVTATARVSVTLAHGEVELPVENVVVARIDGNYQIMFFPFPGRWQ